MAAKKKAVKRAAARRPAAKKNPVRKTAPAKRATSKYLRIGEVWKGEGGRYMGTICGEAGQPDYRIVLAPAPQGALKGIYGPKECIKGAQSEYDGMANTKAMAAAGSDLAKNALAVKIEGHSDYYIPSRREARLLQINSRTPIAEGWHWTSTQSRDWADYAWLQYFDGGNQSNSRKDLEFPVRLVRRVAI
jgi:hypothetical protein